MNTCLSDQSHQAFLVAGTIIGYIATACVAAYAGFALLQRRWDAADRQARIDRIEPPDWRTADDPGVCDYYTREAGL